MNTENQPPISDTPPVIITASPLLPLFDLLGGIKTDISSSVDSIVSAVRAQFVKEETDKRTKLLADGIIAYRTAKKNLDNIRPDVIAYDSEGKADGEGTWTKPRVEERKKAATALKKVEDAILAAFKGDFSKLSQLGKPAPANDSGDTASAV